jgi:hypothetical protein
MTSIRRRAGALASAVLLLALLWLLLALRAAPHVTGTVTSRFTTYSSSTPHQSYYLTIRTTAGHSGTYLVPFTAYLNCPRGAHYPICQHR